MFKGNTIAGLFQDGFKKMKFWGLEHCVLYILMADSLIC